jgi:transketolase
MPDRGASDHHAAIRMVNMAVGLWSGHLRHNPTNPDWINRDRFIIADKRAALLLPVLQRLSGYHPSKRASGVIDRPEVSGLADAVGQALTERLLADDFNQPGHSIVDYHTFVLVTQTALEAALSRRACAMAGSLQLKKLVVLSDEKPIQHDADANTGSEVHQHLVQCGWQVIGPVDGHDVISIGRAIAKARHCAEKPTLIRCANAPQYPAHNSDLVSDSKIWNMCDMGALREQSWQRTYDEYERCYPDIAARLHHQAKTRLERVQKDIVSNLLPRLEHRGKTADHAPDSAPLLAIG